MIDFTTHASEHKSQNGLLRWLVSRLEITGNWIGAIPLACFTTPVARIQVMGW